MVSILMVFYNISLILDPKNLFTIRFKLGSRKILAEGVRHTGDAYFSAREREVTRDGHFPQTLIEIVIVATHCFEKQTARLLEFRQLIF